MKLIDKAALVAEIERRIKTNKECMLGLRNLDYYQGKVDALNDTIFSLNTLEVKEVDLSKEIDNYFDNYKFAEKEECWLNHDQAYIFAKHFFELGLKVTRKGKEV